MTLPLSPIDHVFTGRGAYPLEFVFSYAGAIDPGRLEASLRRVLVFFPAATSRLVRLGARYALEPGPDGCALEVAESAEGFDASPSRTRFVAPVETLEGEPLARVRLTQTPQGSVLGVAMSHAVVDGFSYFHFLAAWSRAFRGEPFPPPSHERERLEAAGAALATIDAGAVQRGCGLFFDAPRESTRRERLRWTRHAFPAAELRELHEPAQEGCPVRLSHNDVVAAWLWQRHASGWIGADEPQAWLSCPVDVRRLLPGFPQAYFGCAVALAGAAIERERLASEPLGALARRVRDAVAAIDAAGMSRSLATIEAVRERFGLAGLERLHVVHPRAGLLVTNLSRLPVRDIVFDAGAPVAFDILVPAERCAVVLPAEDGLDVRVCEPGATGNAPGGNRSAAVVAGGPPR
jgi:shikimate O-hydroxycinnamoyltransferase